MNSQSSSSWWSRWLPELYILISWWSLAAVIGWWFSWVNSMPSAPNNVGLVVVGAAYVSALSSYWVLGDSRGPLQSLFSWAMFVAFALVTSLAMYVVAANGTLPNSLVEVQNALSYGEKAWPRIDSWGIFFSRAFLLVAIPFGAWLLIVFFGNLLHTKLGKPFIEQLLSKKAPLSLLILSMLAVGIVYVLQLPFYQYPNSSAREVDTHAFVPRLAMAIAIGQLLFLMILDALPRIVWKTFLLPVLAWCALFIEMRFQITRQASIDFFIPVDYFHLIYPLMGAMIAATGFMFALACVGRLPSRLVATAGSRAKPAAPLHPTSPAKRLLFPVGLFGLWWLIVLGITIYVPVYIEPGVFFSHRQNRWSNARFHAQLRNYYDYQKMDRRGNSQRYLEGACEVMKLGSEYEPGVIRFRIDGQWTMNPRFHELVARRDDNIHLAIETSQTRCSIADLQRLYDLGFRSLPPTTWDEIQQNETIASLLFAENTSIRDSHVTASILEQLGQWGNRHNFTRCTFSPDFFAALTTDPGFTLSFRDCLQPEVFDVNVEDMDLIFSSFELAPLSKEDWQRVTTMYSTKVMFGELPETLPSYLRIAPSWGSNRVLYQPE